MEYIVGIAVIALVVYFLRRPSDEPNPRAQPSVDRSRKEDDESQWLRERWKLAKEHKIAGKEDVFPKWYFDDVTERQKTRLDDLGIKAGKTISKGQASDLIGMHEPADENALAILRFFKRSTKGMNQTKARHEVAQILSDPDNVKAWESRPPTKEQKEFCKFFGLMMEKGLTASDAEKLITEHESKLAEEEDPRLDEWGAFSEIMEELSDSEMRADYEIKKPSVSLIKSALDDLGQQGKSYRDVADEIDILVEKLVELKPELQRE